MIGDGFQCDLCRKKVVRQGNPARWQADLHVLPTGWYGIEEAPDPGLVVKVDSLADVPPPTGPWQFCSAKCVYRWAWNRT